MKDFFDLTCGSVAGRDHRVAGKNNHDAYHVISEPAFTVAIVCDGCGSGRHSEVGANIGSRLIANAIRGYLPSAAAAPQQGEARPFTYWDRVRQDVLADIRVLARRMDASLSAVVTDYFLFTVVGVLITPWGTSFFSLGDGTLFINGERKQLGPYPDNAPPYLAYGLVETTFQEAGQDLFRFQIDALMPTSEVQTFLIGTDGAADLIQAQHRLLPGKTETVGPISKFWSDDAYFKNPDAARRSLEGINKEVSQFDSASGDVRRHRGLLPDDTTLVAGRRKQEGALTDEKRQ